MKYQQPAQTFENLDRPRLSFSGFDLSHRHTTTFDLGEVIPIAVLETIPNDRWDLSATGVLRMQPLVAPLLHPIKLKVQAWFVPYRLLMYAEQGPGSWEEFITGGDQGTTVTTLPIIQPQDVGLPDMANEGSLWDRFGMNPLLDASTEAVHVDNCPIAFPWSAYLKIWNDWFRVPGIQPARDATSIFWRPFYYNWPRDYFTSALPFLQRGVSPSLPVLGSISGATTTTGTVDFDLPFIASTTADLLALDNGSTNLNADGNVAQAGYKAKMDTIMSDNNSLDATSSTTITASLSTVDIKQIRLAFLYQSFLERMARGGARYAEMLPNIWGARPLDQRLMRAEYIGGYEAPWITSEVLQTSSSDTQPTPQGNMAGHGIAIPSGNLGRYRVDEHGLIMITAVAYPDAAYQQGMPRAWLRRTREEFPSRHSLVSASRRSSTRNSTTKQPPQIQTAQ